MLSQLVAQAGRAAVAVTTLWVKDAQKGEAVAALDLMKLAHLLVFALRQAKAAGTRARRVKARMMKILLDVEQDERWFSVCWWEKGDGLRQTRVNMHTYI